MSIKWHASIGDKSKDFKRWNLMWIDMNLSKYLLNRFDKRRSKLISTYSISMHICSQSCPILCDPTDCNPRLLSPLDSPGKNTGEVCCFLLQEIFPTWGLKLCLLHPLCLQEESFPLSDLGSPICISLFTIFISIFFFFFKFSLEE